MTPRIAPTRAEVEAVRAEVAASRIAQGLPPTVTDPQALRRLATALRGTQCAA